MLWKPCPRGRHGCRANLALAVAVDGARDVLGMWFQETEGAKFWMQVLTDLKQRGVQDILICCVDGPKGFPEVLLLFYEMFGTNRTTAQGTQTLERGGRAHYPGHRLTYTETCLVL
jgi:hypothetical protein